MKTAWLVVAGVNAFIAVTMVVASQTYAYSLAIAGCAFSAGLIAGLVRQQDKRPATASRGKRKKGPKQWPRIAKS